MPVRAGPQRRHHGQRQHLQPPAEEVLRGQGLVAHLVVVLRARIGHVDRHLGGDLGLELDLVGGRVPPGEVAKLPGCARGRRGAGSAMKPPWCRMLDQRVALTRHDGARPAARTQPASRRCACTGRSPGRPHVRRRISRKLPGCGSPENSWWRYMEPKKKRKTISPSRSRSACGQLLSSSKPVPFTNSLTSTRSCDSEVITSGT